MNTVSANLYASPYRGPAPTVEGLRGQDLVRKLQPAVPLGSKRALDRARQRIERGQQLGRSLVAAQARCSSANNDTAAIGIAYSALEL